MNDTPKTDALQARWPMERFGEMAGLARELETENARMRKQLLRMADWLAMVRKAAIKNEKSARGRFDSLADAHKADAANAEVMERHCRDAVKANKVDNQPGKP